MQPEDTNDDLSKTWPVGTKAQVIADDPVLIAAYSDEVKRQQRLVTGDYVTVIGSNGENLTVDLLGAKTGAGWFVTPACLRKVTDDEWPVFVKPNDLPTVRRNDDDTSQTRVLAEFNTGGMDAYNRMFVIPGLDDMVSMTLDDLALAILTLARERRRAERTKALIDDRRRMAMRTLENSAGLRGNSNRVVLAGALVDHPGTLVTALEYLNGKRDDELTEEN